MSQDFSQRFLFDKKDIRGELVQLEGSFAEILAQHYYPESAGNMLGQFLAASVLLSSTIKFEGRLILQIQSQGEIPLVVAECSSEQVIRGLLRLSDNVVSDDFHRQFAKGTLAITIEPKQGERYQGLVALDGNNLAECLQNYFMQSEQLRAHLLLAVSDGRVAGLMLQELPSQAVIDREQRNEDWEYVTQLAKTVQADELLSVSSETLIHRLYHQDDVRLFASKPIVYRCSCSLERTQQALRSISRVELDEIVAEQGAVTMNCEFCNQEYRFDAAAIDSLFSTSNKLS